MSWGPGIVKCEVILVLLILLTISAPLVSPEDKSPSEMKELGPPAPSVGPTMYVNDIDGYKGFTLVAPVDEHRTLLINNRGEVVHVWTSNRTAKGTSVMLPNGTLIRGVDSDGTPNSRVGMQMIAWNGTILWDYSPPAPYNRHHDLLAMPNGTILFQVRQTLTKMQAVNLGRDPALTTAQLWVESVWEIRPNGTHRADILWKWNPLGHMIQDFDPSKANYGVVADHPELLDINFPPKIGPDWAHLNTVAYNPKYDQVMIMSRHFSEAWVVDHNTTTLEAAGHSGGTYGRGGDLLYRWGNPQAYGAGDANDQIFYGSHDAQWIHPGYPGEGDILVFNNGESLINSRPDGKYSTVDEFVPPDNDNGTYNYTKGTAYGPTGLTWRYKANPPTDFFGGAMGGVQRLPDGNTLVCNAPEGFLFEVTPENKVVWSYTAMTDDGTSRTTVFKARRYYPPAIDAITDLKTTEDVPFKLNLTQYVSDPDTDFADLVIAENSSYADIVGNDLQLVYPEGVLKDTINLTVYDGLFEVAKVIHVNVTPVNDPPVLAPIPDQKATEDVQLTLDLGHYISDPDTRLDDMVITDNSTYANVSGHELRMLYPEGVLKDRINLTVSDDLSSVSRTVLVNVTPVNDPPVIVGDDLVKALEDSPYVSQYKVRDVDRGDTVFIWSLRTNASWLKLGAATGNLTGLPENKDVGIYWVNVTVQDPAHAEDHRNFTLRVINTNDAPTWTDVPVDTSILVGKNYIFDVNASDIDVGDVLSYSVSSTPVTSIKIGVASGLIEWTPDTEGPYRINISATDGNVTIHHEFQITVEPDVNPNHPPRFVSGPRLEAGVGVRWTYEPVALDDDAGDNVSIALIDRPSGMVFEGKALEWTPTADQLGNHTVRLEATDSKAVAFQEFKVSVTLVAPNHMPSIERIENRSIRAGDVLSLQVKASDQDGNALQYSILDGPSGIGIDEKGLLTWKTKSTDMGVYNITVKVSDKNGSTTSSFTLTVMKAGTDGAGLGTFLPLLIIVIVAMVATILTVMVISKRRRGKAPPETSKEGP